MVTNSTTIIHQTLIWPGLKCAVGATSDRQLLPIPTYPSISVDVMRVNSAMN